MTRTTLETLAAKIEAPDPDPAMDARDRLRGALRAGGLGQLAELAIWWAGVRGRAESAAPDQVVLVAPAAPGPAVGARIPFGTVHLDPPLAAELALGWGADRADALADAGTGLILLAVGDPLPARVLAAHLLGLDPVEANGWPQDSGIDDAGWMREVTAVRDRLHALRGLRAEPDQALLALGSPQLAAAAGLLARAVARQTPVLLDGPAAAAAALLVRGAATRAGLWWRPAGLSPHPLHARLLTALGEEPLIRLGIGAEDGTAALLALGVLDQAAGLLSAASPTDGGRPEDR